jgi:hypothetical protein
MNGFIQKNKQLFFLVLTILLGSPLGAVTFRNQPISNFIEPGQSLCIEFPEDSFVQLEVSNDTFDVRGGDIDKLEGLEKAFQLAMDNRGGSISSKTCNMSTNIIDDTSSYLIGRENINIQARTSAQFSRCLFESPRISLAANEIRFNDSFLIKPEVLNIVVHHPESEYEIIQILFHDQPKNPSAITGAVDFKDKQKKQTLLISNVKEVRVQFARNVFVSK